MNQSVSQDDNMMLPNNILNLQNNDQSIDPMMHRDDSMMDAMDLPSLHNLNNRSAISAVNITTFHDEMQFNGQEGGDQHNLQLQLNAGAGDV